MKKIVKILLTILLVISVVVWLLFLTSGHNVPVQTHASFMVFILLIAFILWVLKMDK